ncbi:hypothetical protein BIZ36_17200, partial [Cytophaga sp. FL35]|nr:hypothetical protein [Cytophaga sp. FL35]
DEHLTIGFYHKSKTLDVHLKNHKTGEYSSHRNGIIDEKFLQYYSAFSLNEEHQMTIEEVFNHLSLLLDSINRIDKTAIDKYNLATID